MYAHDTHYGWLIPPPTHYAAVTVGGLGGAPSTGMLGLNEGVLHPSTTMANSSNATTFDRYGRAVSNRSIGGGNRAAPYTRHRNTSASGSNGSGGNPSPPQPPSAPQTPTSFHQTTTGNNGGGGLPYHGSSSSALFSGSSYCSQGGYSLPLDPPITSSMYAYSGSWQNSGSYWPSASIPTAMPITSSRSLCKYTPASL